MNSQDKLDLVATAQEVDGETAGQVMAELLTDVSWETTNMFYDLADWYISGSSELQKGIDIALSILTGYHIDTIAQKVIDAADGLTYDDDDDTW